MGEGIFGDALTEALNGLRLSSAIHCPWEGVGTWGLAVPEKPNAAPFFIVTQGSGWLEMEGIIPTEVCAGDFVIIPHGAPYTIKNKPGSPTIPLQVLLDTIPADADGILRCGTGHGATTCAIGGAFFFEDAQTSPLLRVLPPVLRVTAEQGQTLKWLGNIVRFIGYEISGRNPGAETVITRLSDILFVKAIRVYLGDLLEGEGEWLGALSDPQIGAALAQIHTQPQKPWRVETLAELAAMSRSAFAARFAALTGRNAFAVCDALARPPGGGFAARRRLERGAGCNAGGLSIGGRVQPRLQAMDGRITRRLPPRPPRRLKNSLSRKRKSCLLS